MRWGTLRIGLLALLAGGLLGCGGGGGGGSSPGGVTVTVSPKTVAVVLNGTLQFFATVTGGQVQVATIVAANGAVRASNVVTITTTAPHALVAGETVTIAGVSDNTFNGTFTVTSVPSPTAFTYPQTGTDVTSGGGTVSASTVKWSVNGVDGGNATAGTITTSGLTGNYTAPASLPPATTLTITSNGAVRASSLVTITTTAAHNLVVGQIVTISGVTDASFNGSFFVASVPSTTTFTYAQAGTDAKSGSGSVTSTSVQVKATSVADNTKSDTATVSVDSGITISISPRGATVGTGENLQFLVTVTGTSNTDANWFVNDTQGGSSTLGTISTNGLYTAPAMVPSPATVTIKAASKLDILRTASTSLTVVTAADPTLDATTPLNPTSAAQGSLFQDIYLKGTNFISTTTVLVNGIGVTANAVTSSLIRARIPDCLLASAGTLAIKVQRQNGTVAGPVNFTVSPARPALVGAFPDSARQTLGVGATNFNVNGGYFGPAGPCTPPATPAVTAEYDGNIKPVSLASARQLALTIGGSGTSDLATPGLVAVGVRNSGAAQPLAVTNFAVQPDPAIAPPSAFPALVVGKKPGAVAINTATGITVVANHDDNTISLIDLTPAAPVVSGAPIAVGKGPTGVAVDNVRNLAVTANNTDNSVTIIDLNTRTVTSTITANIGAAPFSVGVNPLTGMAVVAYQSTNSGSLIDLKLNPPAVVGSVSIGTGLRPQITIEPRLNWAMISPGGAGTFAIVNMGQTTFNPIAAAPTGASRASNVVTITTTANHGLVVGEAVLISGVADASFNGVFSVASVPSSTTFTYAQAAANATSGGGAVEDLGRLTSNAIAAAPTGASRAANIVTVTTAATHGLQAGEAVLIIGVADASFNGIFTVSAVPSSTTFTYAQTGPNATSGGGAALYSLPLVTVSVGTTVTGIALNPETEKAILTDPNSGTVFFLDALDQGLPQLSGLELGIAAAAVNPLTDIAVTANFNLKQVRMIDPRTPATLGSPISVGAGPRAVAIDPGSNRAVVANETDGTVTVISLGPIRPLHVTQVFIPAASQLNPETTLTSANPLTLTVVGKGFVAGSLVRLDGTALPAPTGVTDRQLTVSVPAAMLGGPRSYALDVLNPGNVHSNASVFTVAQAVDMTSMGCTAPAPLAVAIDAERNLAVVTNSGCKNVALIDTGTGTVKNTVAVGTNPQGVAVISRLGKAVVTNRGDKTASVVTLDDGKVPLTVNVGTGPIGVAINQDTAVVVVANSDDNSVSVFSADTGGASTTANVGPRPIAVAVDPDRNDAAVANAAGNSISIVDISQATPAQTAALPGPQLPTGVAFDPVTKLFFATSSLGNAVVTVNPDTQQVPAFRVGVNPTSLALNFQSSTLITLNSASNTISIVDLQQGRVRAILPLVAGTRLSVDIHPRTNLAVIADTNNNRVLLLPLRR